MSGSLDIKENIYGHAKRLRWIVSHLNEDDKIVELGCGTGYMISLQLARMGFDIHGVDLHEKSIEFGREIFLKEGFDPERLKALDIADLDFNPDVVIASEVFEHIPDTGLAETLGAIRSKLCPGGRLLVTVPNGNGWFELESFFWSRLRIGRFMERFKIMAVIFRIKAFLFGKQAVYLYSHPSTLSESMHVQRFTMSSVQRLLEDNGFEVFDRAGSVLFAGPFSDLFFTGIRPMMKMNYFLQRLFPGFSAGFYLACKMSRCQ